MKRKKIKLALSVAALVVLSVSYAGIKIYVRNQKEAESDATDDTEIIYSADADQINAIEFLTDGQETTFEKNEDGVWTCKREPEFPVNQSSIENLKGYLCELSSQRTLTDVENMEQYGLDDPQNIITVRTEDGDSFNLEVGEENTSVNAFYAKQKENDQTVYLISSSIIEEFSDNLYDYAQMDEFPFISSTDIYEIQLKSEKEGDYLLTKNESDNFWYVTTAELSDKADSAKASGISSSVGSLSFSAMADYHCEDLSKYGLEDSYAEITVKYEEPVDEDTLEEDSAEDSSSDDNSSDQSSAEENSLDQSSADATVSDEENMEDTSVEILEDSEISDEILFDSMEENAEQLKSDEVSETTEENDHDEQTVVQKQIILYVGDEAENETRYVRVDDSNKIYTMSEETLSSIIDNDLQTLLDMNITNISLSRIDSLEIQTDTAENLIHVSRETSENEDGEEVTSTSYYLDNAEMNDATKFTKFYNKIVNMASDRILLEDEKISDDPEMTIQFFVSDESEKTTAEYYSYDENYYLVAVRNSKYLVNKTTVKEMIHAYDELLEDNKQEDNKQEENNQEDIQEENNQETK